MRPTIIYFCFFLGGAQLPPVGQALLIHHIARSQKRSTTFSRTPLDELSARRRGLYLKTHNTHNRQTSLSPEGFEPTISAGERPQTYALERAAPGTGIFYLQRREMSQNSIIQAYKIVI